MTGVDVIRFSLQTSEHFTMPLIEDLKDHALAPPTANGGNHALWILGHLALGEAMSHSIMFGEPNELEKWAGLFAGGTEPTANAQDYPSFDEVLGAFKTQRARTWKLIETLTDEDLAKASKQVPEGFEEPFGTVGRVLTISALHTMDHRGQICDVRRSLGRKVMIA